MVQAAKILAVILSLFPAGPAPEATVFIPINDSKVASCTLVRGAEDAGRRTFSEEWECFTFNPQAAGDRALLESEVYLGTIERGETNGKAWGYIAPDKGERK